MGRSGGHAYLLGRRWGRAGRGLSDVYGRPRRALRGAALLCGALTLGMSPAAERTPTDPGVLSAPAATTTAPPAPYWPIQWLDGTPTRPNGFPSVDHLVADDVAIAPPPLAFDAPAEATTPPPAALAAAAAPSPDPTGRGVWAVTIGINDYPGVRSDLRSATADARDVDAVLARHGVPSEQRLLILDRQASADTIRAALDWLVAHAGPDATAVLYYAGHVREISRATEAIVAADGGLVTDADVAAHLAPLRAGRTWLAFASCYGAGFDEALAPGRLLTAAADGDSLAYENHDYNRSYLGEYLVRRGLLEGRAGPSIQHAFAWAERELRRDHPNRLPVMIDRSGGDVTLGAPVAPPPPSAPPQPPRPQQRERPPESTTTTSTTEPDRCGFRFGSFVRCPDDDD